MTEQPRILLIDSDVIVRFHLAQYLRDCGYVVVEASSTDEARIFVADDVQKHIDVAFCTIDAGGSVSGFGLAQWLRTIRPDVDIVLVGTAEGAAEKAGELCDETPGLKKPYDTSLVVDRIKRFRAERDRNK